MTKKQTGFQWHGDPMGPCGLMRLDAWDLHQSHCSMLRLLRFSFIKNTSAELVNARRKEWGPCSGSATDRGFAGPVTWFRWASPSSLHEASSEKAETRSKAGRTSAVQVLLSPRRFSIFTKLAHLDIPANINFQTAPWITHPVFILGTV